MTVGWCRAKRVANVKAFMTVGTSDRQKPTVGKPPSVATCSVQGWRRQRFSCRRHGDAWRIHTRQCMRHPRPNNRSMFSSQYRCAGPKTNKDTTGGVS